MVQQLLSTADVQESASPTPVPTGWEEEIASLLHELASTQEELLQVLVQKRDFMARTDLRGIESLQPREQQLAARLQACQQRRTQLLDLAGAEGMPNGSVAQLAAAVSGGKRTPLGRQVRDGSARMRLLQHQSLTNWVLAQRTLLHLSQLLEILATGGRMQPTYDSKGEVAQSSGSLVDRAV